jgi:hypothetical protein
VTGFADLRALVQGRGAALKIPVHRGSAEKLFALPAALGIRLLAVEDTEALARIATRLVKRDSSRAQHAGVVHWELSRRKLSAAGRKGGANSRKNMSRAQAREIGRRAAKARWIAHRGAMSAPGRSRHKPQNGGFSF